MSSTYLSLHYHLVFGTKNRIPSIDKPWRSRLHDYMGGTVRGLGGFPEGIGGTADHVHLLVALKSNHCLADVMRELKKASSAWIHEEIGQRSFAWQEGYAAFTVSTTVRDAVRKYISNQEEHHRLKQFHEELVELLEKAGVEYDQRYLDRSSCDPLRGRLVSLRFPGVSAYGLNPRLMAVSPSGSFKIVVPKDLHPKAKGC